MINKPTRVFNYSDFSRLYGTSSKSSELPIAVRLFFANGGNQAYIMRVAHDADHASVTLKNNAAVPANVLTLTAREAGVRGGDLRVAVDYDTPTPDETFNLRIFLQNQATLQETEIETHTDLTMEPGTARYVGDVLAQDSLLVTATYVNATTTAGDSIGALVCTGDGSAVAEIGNSTMLVQIDDDPPVPVEITGGDITNGILDATLDAEIEYDPITLSGTKYLVRIKRLGPGRVRVLTSEATNDVATILQMSQARGGIETTEYSSLRPAPSGLIADGYGADYANLAKIAATAQGAPNSLAIEVGGTAVTGLNLRSTGDLDKLYVGTVSATESLRNLKEALNLLASQFNAKAQNLADFNWRLTVQGFHLVFQPTTGAGNTGAGTTLESDPTSFIDAMNGFKPYVQNTRYYSFNTSGDGIYQSGTNGTDGSAPEFGDYNTAYEIIDREVDLFNILVLPRDADVSETNRKNLWAPASIFCQKRRAFLLVDPPRTWQTVDDITGNAINVGTLRTGLVKDHAAIYWSPVKTLNEFGLEKVVDASGAIAGVMARTDANRGVWKAPAGLEADLRGVTAVARDMSNQHNGVINALGVNAVRAFTNGIVAWGARTVDGFDNSGNSDYKYVPVRRFALFLGESLYRGLQFAVFEPNAEPLWAQIRLAAGAFMNGLFRQGAFQGQKKSEAYFVKVDAETTTQNDINLGIVNVIVGFAPLKPAEFVIIHLKQIAGQIQT